MQIYLGSPIFHSYDVESALSMRNLVVHLLKNGIPFHDDPQIGPGLIQARNMAASRFLRSKADVLMMIDSDIIFEPEDVVKLCLKAQEQGIMGALYLKRFGQHGATTYFRDNELIEFHKEAINPVEVEYVAGGFMAISRKVLEGIRDHFKLELLHAHEQNSEDNRSFYDFFSARTVFHESTQGMIQEQEDWALCSRAREAGFNCYLDPSIRLGHSGFYSFTLEDLLVPPKPVAQKIALMRKGHTMEVFLGEDGES